MMTDVDMGAVASDGSKGGGHCLLLALLTQVPKALLPQFLNLILLPTQKRKVWDKKKNKL